MKTGKLDRRLQILRAELIDDGHQERRGDYVAYGSPIWASLRDVSDSERFAGDTVHARLTTRFQVRSSSFSRGIEPTDRLECEGRIYGIVGVKQIGRKDGLEITAATL